MLVMAADPIHWLVVTWLDPSYDSKGIWVFAICCALLAWSVTSGRVQNTDADQKRAYLLLILTVVVRCIGQVFAVNVIGAIALVIDMYAIGLLLQVKNRKNALSPGWLAILFAFSLPLERILQRTIGFGLQHLSAKGACGVLQGLFADTHCAGVRILIAGQDVLVDLPCSGARILILLGILYAALMTLFRPAFSRAFFIGRLTLASAVAANILRITLLATFTAFPDKIGGINIMAQPWHDITGLICMTIAALPMLVLSRTTPVQIVTAANEQSFGKHQPPKWISAAAFMVLAVIATTLPRQALDITPQLQAGVSLPAYIQGKHGKAAALSDQESAYFTAFGGSAAKMDFGDSSVMLVRTSSPLRHLHAPDECLRGIGFEVKYAGIEYDTLPTAIYIATRPDGTKWRIAVTFYSDAKQMTTNVSEAVWLWLQQPKTTWHALQRITPLYQTKAQALAWDAAVFSALDLSPIKNEEIAHAFTH